MISYKPQGVCSKKIKVDLDGSKILSVSFVGGCDGNLSAIAKLVQGQDARDVIALLKGHTCGKKPTSCADQLTKALEKALAASA